MTGSSPSTSVPPTRIAIAGFGAWGQMHAKAIDAIDGAEVVAVLARSDAARTAARDLVPQAVVVDDLDAAIHAAVFAQITHLRALIDQILERFRELG